MIPASTSQRQRQHRRDKDNQRDQRHYHHNHNQQQQHKQTLASFSSRELREKYEIPGVFLIENFVTREEELEFIEANRKDNEEERGDDLERHNKSNEKSRGWKSLSKRRVRHYGKKFDYDTRDAANDAEEKIPELLDVELRERLRALISLVVADDDEENASEDEKNRERKSAKNDFLFTRQNANDDAWTEEERRQISEAIQKVIAFDQVTVNEYPPGCGIAPHVDTHSAFTGTILSLSLGDRCVMEFRHPNPNEEAEEEGYSTSSTTENAATTTTAAARQNRSDTVIFPHRALELPRRSLLILTDFARFNRQHYIPKRKSDPMIDGTRRMRTETRYSFTIRQTLSNDGNNNNQRENSEKQHNIRSCDCRFPLFCDVKDGPFSKIISRKKEKEDG